MTHQPFMTEIKVYWVVKNGDPSQHSKNFKQSLLPHPLKREGLGGEGMSSEGIAIQTFHPQDYLR